MEVEKLFWIWEVEEIKKSLMQVVSEYIVLFQDVVDLEIVMKEEILLLEVWKKYWVLLNCVDILIVFDIEWFVVFVME